MEIKQILDTLGIPVSTGIILILISFIKIPKIEINIWQMLGKALSKGLLSDLTVQIDDLSKEVSNINNKLNNHIEKYREDVILGSRQRILRFSDEIIQGIPHTREHFDEILSEIDKYEDYCIEHPHFPNNKCVLACENIRAIYKERIERNDFLNNPHEKKIRESK